MTTPRPLCVVCMKRHREPSSRHCNPCATARIRSTTNQEEETR